MLATRNTPAVADTHAECRESVALISHDLKNPLTRIKGLTQLLQRRLETGHPVDRVEMRERLVQIDRTVGKMTIALNELVETTHGPAGQLPALHRRPTDLVQLVRHLVDEYQHATEDHQICLHTTADEVIGLWDAQRIERVVANLLSNAVKYSPEGGEITVRIERVEPEGWAVLKVSDRGIGIPGYRPSTDLRRLPSRGQRRRADDRYGYGATGRAADRRATWGGCSGGELGGERNDR